MNIPAGFNNPITPEMRVALMTISRDVYETIIKESIDDRIKGILASLNTEMRDSIKKAMKEKLDTFSSETLDEALKGFLQRHNADTTNRLNKLDQQIGHVFQQSMPPYYIQQFNELFARVVASESVVKVMDSTMKNFVSGKFIELVGNDEIKQLYLKSGIGQKEIESLFNVSSSQASRIINGEIQDPQVRHKLKQFLLTKITERVNASV